MNIFIIFFGIILLGSLYLKISIISSILCILMFLIIAFRKSFKNVTLVFFLELSDQEQKFGTLFMNLFMNFYKKLI
jgi:hypothetical protein